MKLQHRESQKTWHRLAKAFWQDERGQSTTEYILILSVVVMIAMKFKTMFLSRMETAVGTLGGNIEKAMEDGQ
jgi:Flp pilus assembly pilin Flp